MDIQHISEKFCPKGDFLGYEQIHAGNINHTFLVSYNYQGAKKCYILQKINKYVFTHPDLMMENITNISRHMKAKIKNIDADNRCVLNYMLTEDNVGFYCDDEGEYWRCYKFVADSLTFDNPDDLFIVEQAGSAFGQFQNTLCDYDVTTLYISIPDFHDTKKRYESFYNSLSENRSNRADTAKEEIEYLKSRYNVATVLCDMIENKELPLKVTHNDTKCNNVLFDIKTHEALAVIDLDTVMPGLVAYDYGDAIRSIASTCDEDETDLQKVDLNMDKFKAFTTGFLSKVRNTLTQNEIKSLSLGVLVMTLELATRFLKDYIDGDIYFKTNHSKHNLERARCQIALAKKIEGHMSEMNKIILELLNR